MDPNAPVPQGDNANFIPPPLEETPSVVPPSIPSPQEPQVVQMPPMEAIPQQPTEPVNPAPVVDQPPTAPIPPVNTPPPEVPTQKSSPIFAIALTVLLIAILGIAGYFLYTKYLVGTGSNEAANTAVTPMPVAVTPTPDPTANWKTYTNPQYGFSFKYPLGAKLGNAKFANSEFSIVLSGMTDLQYEDLTVYVGKAWAFTNASASSNTNFKIGGVNAYREDLPLGQNPPQSLVYVKNGNYYYTIQQVKNEDDAKIGGIFDQLLSTFKFIEASPSSSPISSSSPSAVPLAH